MLYPPMLALTTYLHGPFHPGIIYVPLIIQRPLPNYGKELPLHTYKLWNAHIQLEC